MLSKAETLGLNSHSVSAFDVKRELLLNICKTGPSIFPRKLYSQCKTFQMCRTIVIDFCKEQDAYIR